MATPSGGGTGAHSRPGFTIARSRSAILQAPGPALFSQLFSAVFSTKAASPPPACQPKTPFGPKARTRGVFRLRKRRTLAWLASGRPSIAGASRMGAAGAWAWLMGAATSPISAASAATKPFQPAMQYSPETRSHFPQARRGPQAPLALAARGGHIGRLFLHFPRERSCASKM